MAISKAAAPMYCDAVTGFSGDHVAALMFGDASGLGRGRYMEGRFDVITGGDATAAAARMVSLHEVMHGSLNDSTAFGCLFEAFAALVRHADDGSRFRDVCADVVAACRQVHEVFATYAGVFMADPQAGAALLSGYPAYAAFFNEALALGEGLPECSLLQWYATWNAVVACMQSTAMDVAVERGLSRFTLADVRARDHPDVRLGMLLDAGPRLWDLLAERISVEVAQLPGAQEAVAVLTAAPHRSGSEPSGPATDAVFDVAKKVCYSAAASALAARGAQVLCWDGHMDQVSRLVEQVHELAPASRGHIYRATGDWGEPIQAVQAFAAERLTLRTRPLEATVSRLAEVPARRWSELSAHIGDPRHVFVVGRRAGTLRAQHRIISGMSFLPEDPASPVLAVREHYEDTYRLGLRILDGPAQLAQLRRRTGGLGVVSNISARVLGIPLWERRWLPPLIRAGPVTFLLDADPFIHFRHWAALDLTFRFAVMQLTGVGQERIAFVSIVDAPGLAEIPFLAVCTDVAADAITCVLETMCNAREDTSVVTDRLEFISIVASHLVSDETFFAFTAAEETA